jgi:hypothetical protein
MFWGYFFPRFQKGVGLHFWRFFSQTRLVTLYAIIMALSTTARIFPEGNRELQRQRCENSQRNK